MWVPSRAEKIDKAREEKTFAQRTIAGMIGVRSSSESWSATLAPARLVWHATPDSAR
jgi:hypothetical protein